MVKLPTSILIGPHAYVVRLRKHKKRAGHCNVSEGIIDVHPDQMPSQRADVLVHESLHAIASLTGLSEAWGKREEDYVLRLAPALLDWVRRNPEVIAYLVGP